MSQPEPSADTPPRCPPPEAARADVPSPPASPRDQLTALIAQAYRLFHQKNRRACAQTLALAESTAKHHNMHRDAAQLRQAITILAQGGSPKLLRRKVR